MRLRRITLVSVLILVGVILGAFLTPGGHRGPEVRLVGIVSKAVEPPDSALYTPDWLMAGVVKPQQETWMASFKVLNPVDSGIVLSNGDIKVEIIGPDGNAKAMVLPPRPQLPVLEIPFRISKRSMKFTVPCETTSCRFTI